MGGLARSAPPAQMTGGGVQMQQSNPPRILLCKLSDITGLWRMENLYELPAGEESKKFKDTPERYLELAATAAYRGVSGAQKFGNYKDLKTAMEQAMGADNWQYVLDDKGVLYVYKNRAISTMFYCGIAMENRGGYNTGDMILTPTTPGGAQIYRHYRKITLP